jgi:uncharacterized protein (DUF2126 family)
MTHPAWFRAAVRNVDARLCAHGVKLTIGGEPSYVPITPAGAEWNYAALGPTKLEYAYTFANAVIQVAMPGALTILSPGKSYPGETNPRWVIHLLANRTGSRLMQKVPATAKAKLPLLRRELCKAFRIRNHWHAATTSKREAVWVLPLDYLEDGTWYSEAWRLPGGRLDLLQCEGAAGLRLPLHQLPENALKRALVLEVRHGKVHLFLPPYAQNGFLALLKVIGAVFAGARCGEPIYEGYIPDDALGRWTKLSITPDPGVIEVNLPPCANAEEYGRWLAVLEQAGAQVGLRSFKQAPGDEPEGTGGGNHLLFGGPSNAENPFFRRPRWVAGILRYWQRHPALAYFFTGCYAGPSSQAPRPDESARHLSDLELAYRFLEQLPANEDHRALIGETLRHLHIDLSGNTHRSEVSFDKFWDTSWPGGCRGLIEFRALETMPRADWMASIALLWTALAAMLVSEREPEPLVPFGAQLHDRYFLPSYLWEDLEAIFGDLALAGIQLDSKVFRKIWAHRFPLMLEHRSRSGNLTIRKAIESWPLLCETPQEGGTTSRFVDSSIERLEFLADANFYRECRVFVADRELELQSFPNQQFGAGLRYRRTAFHPALHPGVPVQLPLVIIITDRRKRALAAYQLEIGCRKFVALEEARPPKVASVCKRAGEARLTYDLRLT